MLQPAEYFDFYGKKLAELGSVYLAWDATEREFFKLYGMRKYVTFRSFCDAHSQFRSGYEFRRVILHIVKEIKFTV